MCKNQKYISPVVQSSECIHPIELPWSQSKDLFFLSVDHVFPSVQWNKWKMKHWFSGSTIKLIRRKKHLYHQYKRSGNPATLRKYKSTSNIVRSKCRQETAFHSNLVCQQSHTSCKQFWRRINTVQGYHDPIPPLHNCGNKITKDSEKASLLNFYTSNLDSLTPDSSRPTIIDSISITPEEVYAELSNLNVNKACGPDRITLFLLKNAADFISIPPCCLFNKSRSSGTLPFDWVSGNLFQYTSAMTSIILVIIHQLVSHLL